MYVSAERAAAEKRHAEEFHQRKIMRKMIYALANRKIYHVWRDWVDFVRAEKAWQLTTEQDEMVEGLRKELESAVNQTQASHSDKVSR